MSILNPLVIIANYLINHTAGGDIEFGKEGWGGGPDNCYTTKHKTQWVCMHSWDVFFPLFEIQGCAKSTPDKIPYKL